MRLRSSYLVLNRPINSPNAAKLHINPNNSMSASYAEHWLQHARHNLVESKRSGLRLGAPYYHMQRCVPPAQGLPLGLPQGPLQASILESAARCDEGRSCERLHQVGKHHVAQVVHELHLDGALRQGEIKETCTAHPSAAGPQAIFPAIRSLGAPKTSASSRNPHRWPLRSDPTAATSD